MDTCSVEVPGAGAAGAGAEDAAATPSEAWEEAAATGRGEEKESINGIVSPVLSVTAKNESSVLFLGTREGVGRRVVFGAERRAAHQGWVRKCVRSADEGAGEGIVVVIVVVVVVEGEGICGEDGIGDACSDISSSNRCSNRRVSSSKERGAPFPPIPHSAEPT